MSTIIRLNPRLPWLFKRSSHLRQGASNQRDRYVIIKSRPRVRAVGVPNRCSNSFDKLPVESPSRVDLVGICALKQSGYPTQAVADAVEISPLHQQFSLRESPCLRQRTVTRFLSPP